MKLWDKGTDVDKFVERFTVSADRELDIYIAEVDVVGSIAHVKMLGKVGLLTSNEVDSLCMELRKIYGDINKGKFRIDDGVEDVHSQIEFILTEHLGDIGKKVHTGRSRNDQVLVDIRLFTRDKILEVAYWVSLLFYELIRQSEKNKDVLMPGYTHLQVAMPSSFGLWFGAYAEALVDDLRLLLSAYQINNQNPLGSAAGYGSSFPLDRTYTTHLLGFDGLDYNVVYAQMGRVKVERIVAFALSNLASTVGRMASDLCLFTGQNFGFVSLPDNFTTGSSIMPHKKNPDIFETTRGKCNRLQALPAELSYISGNLPSGYFRDYQIAKESFLPVFDEVVDTLNAIKLGVENLKINADILQDSKYDYLFTVEKVNELVLQGIPFREAYRIVGIEVESGKFSRSQIIQHTHEGSIGNLCNRQIITKFKSVYTYFNPESVRTIKENLLNG